MEYKGYTIKIEQDNDSMNPCKDFDMLGTMVFWHRRMNLGHSYQETHKMSPDEWFIDKLQEMDYATEEWYDNASLDLLLCAFEYHNLLIPVYAYEHGGITIKAGSMGRYWDSWDSGQLGFIYVSHDKIKKEYSVDTITDEILEQAKNCLIAEIDTYDDYLTGNVCGFIVEDSDGEHLDSCWGFYGDDGRKEAELQAKSYVDWKVDDDKKQEQLLDSSCAI